MMGMWSYIRKFGLEYSDLPTILWNVSVFMKVLTLNIYGTKKTDIPLIFYIIVAASLVSYFYVYLGCMVWFVFVRCLETGDTVAAAVVLSLGVPSSIGVLKLLYMFVHIDKIRGLTDAFLEYDASMHPGSERANKIMKYMRDVKKRAIFYWAIVMGNGVIYSFIPLLRPGRHMPEDLMVIYGLEPMFESPNYEIAWLLMLVSINAICYISSNITAYFIVIIGYVETQMLVLSDDVIQIWTNAKAHYETVDQKFDNFLTEYARRNRIMNDYVRKNLKEIMKRHATIKILLNQVRNVSKVPIAVGLILLIVGLITELLGGLENTILLIPFAFIQVGIDCYIGQKVMDAGVVFEQAVYDCQWENFDKDNMKTVLVMLQVAQKPTAISAGGFTTMNFRCLMAAMRATFSAFTTFRSVMKS
uniref:Odorant receptor n=1 Tax=Athetis dissimilis TaxID=1737331 RepID=A0A0S1TRB2_ATHDI|nr:odorant receptor 37 [Athetis dissimilis]